ncbi:MAG: protein translocase subunit SecD [Bdellovibrionota bacterium]
MSSDVKNRTIVFLTILVVAILLLVPTFFKTKSWFSKPISLGLDLRGGAHLVYDVQVREAVMGRLQSIANSARTELRNAKVPVLRAYVEKNNQIYFTLLNKSTSKVSQEKIKSNFPELVFVREEITSGEQVNLVYTINNNATKEIENTAVQKSLETLRNRVDQFGVAEPVIQRKGETAITLQMPGVSDVESLKKVIGSVAKLEFRIVVDGGSEEVARSVVLKDKEGNSYRVSDTSLMTGDVIQDARPAFDSTMGQPEIALTFTSEGGRTFYRITSNNVGKRLAIILDNVVYSAPVIRDAIAGGRASISGVSLEEAKQLSVILKAGALPASLVVIEERTVGPSLGRDSIKKGVEAILIGFAAVIIFMVVYYRKSGFVAVCSLALSLILILALLSAFGATLTLPGLAGLALTIGMAVDSNVIIFERIRDELLKGASRDAAVEAGFDKAFSAIIDSNLTTLLTGIVLYYFGTGPIRGFAVTLAIGVLTTLYCATFASRLAFSIFELKNKKTNTLSI